MGLAGLIPLVNMTYKQKQKEMCHPVVMAELPSSENVPCAGPVLKALWVDRVSRSCNSLGVHSYSLSAGEETSSGMPRESARPLQWPVLLGLHPWTHSVCSWPGRMGVHSTEGRESDLQRASPSPASWLPTFHSVVLNFLFLKFSR